MFIINTQEWQWAFAVCTIETALCLILQMLLVDETFFNRKIPFQRALTPGGPGWQRLVDIEQWRSRHQRRTFAQAAMHPVRVIMELTVLLSTVYYLFTLARLLGINTTLSIFVGPLHELRSKANSASCHFTPTVAPALLGEMAGQWRHDIIAGVLTRGNNGTFQPEVRRAVMMDFRTVQASRSYYWRPPAA